MAAEGWVDIVHPTGASSTVQESTLPAWESTGWTRADNGGEESVQQQPPPSPPSQPTPPESGDLNEE